jgi:peroxiredoxin
MKKKILLIMVLLLVVIPLIGYGCLSKTSSATPSNSGQSTQSESKTTAPNFSWKDNSGSLINLSDLKGKVVLLDFWATWCGPCRETIPHVEAIYEKYLAKGVEVLGINLDDTSKLDSVKQFIKDNGMKYQVINDASGTVSQQYGVTSIPRFFIVDKNGYIDKMIIGYDPNMEIVISTEIDKLLKE